MNSYGIESEIVITSAYCDIIYSIAVKAEIISVNKAMPFAYLIRYYSDNSDLVYDLKTNRDYVYKALSLLGGQYENYQRDIPRIIEAIDIMIHAGVLIYKDGMISSTNKLKMKHTIFPFFLKAIIESKKVSERQFMREVIRNV